MATKTVAKTQEGGPVIYCGPNLRGICLRHAVFTGGLPEAFKKKAEEIKEITFLTVPVKDFATTERLIGTDGTAQQSYFKSLVQKLKTGGAE